MFLFDRNYESIKGIVFLLLLNQKASFVHGQRNTRNQEEGT